MILKVIVGTILAFCLFAFSYRRFYRLIGIPDLYLVTGIVYAGAALAWTLM